MVTVIASITIAAGKRTEFLERYLPYAQEVRGEAGCLEYLPMVDLDAALPLQQRDERVVTVLEKWRSLEEMTAHLESPRLQRFMAEVQDVVHGLSLKVLQDA